MFLLCWNFYFFVQEFGGNISSIWPAECVELWVDSELLEGTSVLKWIKHLAVKFLTHVYIAFGSVRKKDVNRIVVFVFCSYYLRYHFSTPTVLFSGVENLPGHVPRHREVLADANQTTPTRAEELARENPDHNSEKSC
jgi:hypothetical protein